MHKILSDPTKLSHNPANPSKVNFTQFRKSSSPQKKGNPVKLAISTSEWPKFDSNPNQDTGQGTQSATNSKLNPMSDISPRNLQIFKHSLQSKGEYPRLDATVKPAVGPNQIKRDDSPSLVKYIIEKANEGNRIAKKDKTHGIMYINELWDGNYERKTMKATKVSGAMIRLGRLGRQFSGRYLAKQGSTIQVDANSKKPRKQDTVFKLQIHPDCEGEILPPPPQVNNQYDGNSEREPSSRTSTLVIDPSGKPGNFPGLVPPLKRHSSLPKMLNLQLLSAPKSSIGGSNTARSSSPREGPNVSISPRGKDLSSPCSARLKKDDVSLTQTTKNSELITQKTVDSFGRVHNRTKSEKIILTNFHEKLEANMPLVKTELSTRRSSNQYTVDSPTTVREAKKAKLFIQNKGQDLSELIDKCKSELEGRNEWLKNFEKVFSSTKSGRKREMENNKNLDVFKFSKASLMH